MGFSSLSPVPLGSQGKSMEKCAIPPKPQTFALSSIKSTSSAAVSFTFWKIRWLRSFQIDQATRITRDSKVFRIPFPNCFRERSHHSTKSELAKDGVSLEVASSKHQVPNFSSQHTFCQKRRSSPSADHKRCSCQRPANHVFFFYHQSNSDRE